AREVQLPPLQLAELLSQGISVAGSRLEPQFEGKGFGPADVQIFYDETPLLNAGIDGSGSDCIALLEISDFPEAGPSTFDQLFSLPEANITRVFPDTTSPGDSPSQPQFEATLDV